jgi:hypothetical protein
MLLPRRYPGLKPFERSQRAVFHGRRDDVQRLTNLIVRERLTVLFSKSGIGKTSLLQAGVAPELEGQGFTPIFLRADQTESVLTTTFGEVLRTHPEIGGYDATDEQPGAEQTLWELLKRQEFDHNGLPATPVLIFDQFEEVFTLSHSEASRRRFLGELADLANETMPEAIRAALLRRVQLQPAGDHVEAAAGASVDIMQWWERQPELRLVVSIRSDFLHLLDDVSPLIPGILRSRYQLRPLGREQAREAIEAPAGASGDFASAPFRYRPDALTEMLDFLAGRTEQDGQATGDGLTGLRRQEEIESFNLQILCQYVEEKIIAETQPAGFEVTSAFYAGHEGLEREIRDFYQKQLENLPELYTRRTGRQVAAPRELIETAKRIIEESLVTPIGRRCSMVDDFLTAQWQVEPAFLDTLVDSRLLRKELRLNDYYYEISHDTLLPAVVESRDERRRREKADQEKQALAEQLAEEAKRRETVENELRTVREKRELARRLAMTSVATLVVTLLFCVWLAYNWVRSVHRELGQADNNLFLEQYAAAVAGYEALGRQSFKSFVLGYTPPQADMTAKLQSARQLQALYNSIIQQDLQNGDSLFFAEQYARALHYYTRADTLLDRYALLNDSLAGRHNPPVDPARVQEKQLTLDQRQKSAFNTLRVQFDVYQRKYEAFAEARAWPLALRSLEAMRDLVPLDSLHRAELQTRLGLTQDPQEYVESEMRRCAAELE